MSGVGLMPENDNFLSSSSSSSSPTIPLRFEEALQEAQQVDKLLSEGVGDEDFLQEKFPFLGVPFTVKEAFALHGVFSHSLYQPLFRFDLQPVLF